VQTWRPVAKDGFTLPPQQATVQPSATFVASGETEDFEFTPDAPEDLKLEVDRVGGFAFRVALPLHVDLASLHLPVERLTFGSLTVSLGETTFEEIAKQFGTTRGLGETAPASSSIRDQRCVAQRILVERP
jgi:hypothetical protein